MTESEFIAFIEKVKGCLFTILAYMTGVESIKKKLVGRKKSPYYGHLITTTTISGAQIGANYENAVKNRVVKEEKFVAETLPLGELKKLN